jgi:hypothetical protein
MSKPTKAVISARIEEILRIRLDGAEFWDVREYAREKCAEAGSIWENPKCLSDGQLYRYIARADKLIAESCRSSRKRLTRRHLAQRRNLYAKAVNSGDLRTALAVLADEARLLGLFPTEKQRVEVTGKGGKAIESNTTSTVTVKPGALTPDDLEYARRFLDAAGRDVPPDGGSQPVYPERTSPPPTTGPSPQ